MNRSTPKQGGPLKLSRNHLRGGSDPVRSAEAVLMRPFNNNGDWRPVLWALLELNNHKHAVRDKERGRKAQDASNKFLVAFFEELHAGAGYRHLDPRQLGNRHVQVMVQRWVGRGLATGTIHSYLSMVRTFAGWIHKDTMVKSIAEYLPAGSPHAHRVQVATTDHSWTAKGVEPVAKIEEVRAYDPWVAFQLELCLRFGLRAMEARFFRPHEPLIARAQAHPRDAAAFPEADCFVRIHRGTKGGRPRDVPVLNAEQRELLKRLRASVAKGGFVGDPKLDREQAKTRFYTVLDKFGITQRGSGVTAHGLRHQMVNDRFEMDTGQPSPIRSMSPDQPLGVAEARNRATRSMGHSRDQIVSAYIGGSAAAARAQRAEAERLRVAAAVESLRTAGMPPLPPIQPPGATGTL